MPLRGRGDMLRAVNERYRRDPAFEHLRYLARFVPGCGPVRPRLIIIGEAPGEQEDRKQIPFVGASGRLLEELLYSINLERADCYITNVIKYRPHNNRDPRPEELVLSKRYLDSELAIIHSKVIVTLGRFALQATAPYAQLSAQHGEKLPYKDGTRILIPCYHPAWALRWPGEGQKKELMFEDFRKVGQALGTINGRLNGVHGIHD